MAHQVQIRGWRRSRDEVKQISDKVVVSVKVQVHSPGGDVDGVARLASRRSGFLRAEGHGHHYKMCRSLHEDHGGPSF